VEGSRNASGRQPSVWDCFDTTMPGPRNGVDCGTIKAYKPDGAGNIWGGENAAVADDDYNRYGETVAELGKFGFGAYRMSISWSRVLSYSVDPATLALTVTRNEAGIAHYREVLSALNRAGIDVALTMWHWDTPQALENYASGNPACRVGRGGSGSFWLCPDSDRLFRAFAELLLEEYGQVGESSLAHSHPRTLPAHSHTITR
jgi:beta-glucosidase/6-phospho-beta-glucosidase/beta-galactosidase